MSQIKAPPVPPAPSRLAPSLYYVHPLLLGRLALWPAHMRRIAALGFTHVLVAPPFAPARHGSLTLSARHDRLHPALDGGDALQGLAAIARMAREAGLVPWLDLVPGRVAAGSPLGVGHDTPFTIADTTLDPRQFDPDGDAVHAGNNPAQIAALAGFWAPRLRDWYQAGIAGCRLSGLAALGDGFVRQLAGQHEGMTLAGALDGVAVDGIAAYAGCGLDFVFNSLPWWDGAGDWFWREQAALRQLAPVIAAAEHPFGPRHAAHWHDPLARGFSLQRQLAMAALLGCGWMACMGNEYGALRPLDPRRGSPAEWEHLVTAPLSDLTAHITELNALRAATPVLQAHGMAQPLGGIGAPVLAILRGTAADPRLPGEAALALLNLRHAASPVATASIACELGGYFDLGALAMPDRLDADQYWVGQLSWRPATLAPRTAPADTARLAAARPRIAIEAVQPCVDDGRFPARFCVGDVVTVEADLICDGHDRLAAELLWRGPDDAPGRWRGVPMRPIGNDRWQASLDLAVLGDHQFTLAAWKDSYATYRDELDKKFAAGLDVTLELEEGRRLVEAHEDGAGAHVQRLRAIGRDFAEATPAARVALLLSDDTAALMQAVDRRPFETRIDPPFPLEAERAAARFASWYEIFPRSMSGDASRHGTFDDVIAHLPRIEAMGFDVLYFPPIHPIGRKNRKGRNNALVAGETDPGSPYGISDHMAVHDELGSLEDFKRLCGVALTHGLEIAIDFAVQCAPDHPWLAQHRGWFEWRPDGSIRYAENPPKKYQDIVNVDFYAGDAVDGLWIELAEVVLFWCAQGVRIFRVDNPHTKPLPFWQWLIATVRLRHPDALFLAEAFTKPKMMNRLAKIGFSQSYTYFTWRNTSSELRDYLTELNQDAASFFRPNFFVNTPDINPVFLQTGGRPAHLIRAALAATLSGLWGVYSGFELADATPLPGREEYLDSEKYQIRVWDWARPGNIVPEITRLNWIRRLNPALQSHLGISFLPSGNDRILVFEKATPDRANVVLVAINLDPFQSQETMFEVPLWKWSLPDWERVRVQDLVFETEFDWTGKHQHVRLDPHHNPYAIWRVRPMAETA